jgi:hypothetical protein
MKRTAQEIAIWRGAVCTTGREKWRGREMAGDDHADIDVITDIEKCNQSRTIGIKTQKQTEQSAAE